MEYNNKKLIRNPKAIDKLIDKKGDRLIANTDLVIIFPQKFVDKHISTVGNVSKIVGIFIIVDPSTGKYALSIIPTRVLVTPSEISTFTANNEVYVVLHISKNTLLINSTKVIKDKSVAYELFELFFIQAKVPFYLGYNDLPKVFKNIKRYTGSNAANDDITFELLTAIISRDPSNPSKSVRETLKGNVDDARPIYKGLKDIHYVISSNLAKITGSYFKTGLISVINNPATEVDKLESLVRD